MASSSGYLSFILEQLSGLDGITYRAMMGEFIIYYRQKIIGGIYDDRFLVKPVKAAERLMPGAVLELPYEGGKEMLPVDDVDNREFLAELVLAMYDELPAAFALMTEIITASKLTDEGRLLEILEELKSRMQGNMTAAGHSLAAVRAMSYFSETAAVSELVSGIPCYRMLEKLTSDFDANKDELVEKLGMLMKCIFRPENLMVDITATEEGFEAVKQLVPSMKEKLFTATVRKERFGLSPQKRNEAFSTSAQIQYVCRAGNYMTNTDYKYTGALRVLKVILGYDYLWLNVRVKGGAYGCMCNFGKTGDSYLVSYRDPNLSKTVDIFEKTGDYLRSFDADERTMTKYIIGAVSDMDVPMTPAVKGARSSSAYLTNLSLADLQKERDELLSCTQEDIRALAGFLDAIIGQEAVCVVGNSQSIEENRELFMNVENLFH